MPQSKVDDGFQADVTVGVAVGAGFVEHWSVLVACIGAQPGFFPVRRVHADFQHARIAPAFAVAALATETRSRAPLVTGVAAPKRDYAQHFSVPFGRVIVSFARFAVAEVATAQ